MYLLLSHHRRSQDVAKSVLDGRGNVDPQDILPHLSPSEQPCDDGIERARLSLRFSKKPREMRKKQLLLVAKSTWTSGQLHAYENKHAEKKDSCLELHIISLASCMKEKHMT
jgi:hypothetical protein